jgi:hypothetical protein
VNSWKVILATLVIFAAGVITGGLLVTCTDGIQRHQRKAAFLEAQRQAAQKPGTNTPPRVIRVPVPPNIILRKEFLERLDHELKLNAEQHERIEKIIGEGQDRVKKITDTIEPQVHEQLAEARERIRAELTPEQQDLFLELLKRRFNPPKAATNSPAPLTATNSLPADRAK